jgi:hypothetical protein
MVPRLLDLWLRAMAAGCATWRSMRQASRSRRDPDGPPHVGGGLKPAAQLVKVALVSGQFT